MLLLNELKAGLQAGGEQTAAMRVSRRGGGEEGRAGVKTHCGSKQRERETGDG